MKKGEIIDLSSLNQEEARKIVRNHLRRDFDLLNLHTIFCCRNCGAIVLRASVPNVKIIPDPNEEPYCSECNQRSGKYVKMEATGADL